MLSFGTQSVQAKCFGDGATWPNREVRKRPSCDAGNAAWDTLLTRFALAPQEARSFVYDACHKNGGMFTGNFAPLQLKAMCPRSGNMGVEFVVQNQNREVGFDLGDDDCSERLNDEIFACAYGGESVIAGWYFR